MRNVDVNIMLRLKNIKSLMLIHMMTVSLTPSLLQVESLQKQVRVLLLKESGWFIYVPNM